jgi:hypothetical protein
MQNSETNESDKEKFIARRAVMEGEGNPGLVLATIKRLLEALGTRLRLAEGTHQPLAKLHGMETT